ncbi:MAG: hypothetical protein Q8927_20165, partial [Bacteroidota bacterium]|nr:hypothetical protein [Bacteroidota bacterium]
FVTVIGYRNRGSDSLSGSIVLFYNERQFGQAGFALAEKRYYNREDSSTLQSLMASLSAPRRPGEDLAAAGPEGGHNGGWKMVNAGSGDPLGQVGLDLIGEETTGSAAEAQSMLRSLENTYSQHTVLHFHAIHPGEEKFVFLDMNTLPGMIRDTNATVGFTAMLVPDNAAAPPELYQMDMQVVASHDPNRILLKSRRINYRFMAKTKELVYRVQFQNTGNGPARRVAIGIGIPHQLDPASVQLKTMSPACRWCDSVQAGESCIDTMRRGDSLYFVFNNIYLPGLSQQGFTDKDSTIGFIEYAVKFRKKPKKIPFSTQAAIIFDHNAPVITNKATARFIKGLSPGIMVGYSLLPSGGGYSATGPLQFGYVLAPYAPSRPYFQAEAFVGLLQQDAFTGAIVKDQADTLIGGALYLISGRQTKTTVQRNSFEITPLHYRYNIGKWIGIGLGAMAQINISEQTTVEHKVYFSLQQLPLNVMTAVSKEKSAVRYLGSWNAAPFADLQIGRVKGGPVVGIRYIRLLSGNITDRFFLYAGFKL